MKSIRNYYKLDSLLIAMLLAIVGGSLDIYSYLARGKVFANTQTGNLVLLGYTIAMGNYSKSLYYIISILAFSIGIILAKLIEYGTKKRRGMTWIHRVLIIQISILFLVAYLPSGRSDILATLLVSSVCGLQVQTFKKVRGLSYSTVMFTGNIRNAVERISHYILERDKKALEEGIIYICIIVCFIIGGWIGSLFTMKYTVHSIAFVNIILVSIYFLLNYTE